MTTLRAPYGLTFLQLDLLRALAALILCRGLGYSCGGRCLGRELWWGVDFARHDGGCMGMFWGNGWVQDAARCVFRCTKNL